MEAKAQPAKAHKNWDLLFISSVWSTLGLIVNCLGKNQDLLSDFLRRVEVWERAATATGSHVNDKKLGHMG